MLISCPECQKQISDKAISCPNCGYPMQPIAKVATSKRAIKKYKKLPNGYGHIKHLDGRRRKPYAAYPAVTEWKDNGSPKQTPAIGYFETYNQALEALALFNKNPYNTDYSTATFADIYKEFYDEKFLKKELSDDLRRALNAGFKNFAPLHNKVFRSLKTNHYQSVIDACPLKRASLEHMKTCVKQMYAYAIKNDITDKDYSQYLTINKPDDDEQGVPFTLDELYIIWKNKDIDEIKILLILIYTGMRISELKVAVYDAEKNVFAGGLKTVNGKKRIVPVHEYIYDYVKEFKKEEFKVNQYRKKLHEILKQLGIEMSIENTVHTPHDARHTFSWLADKYKMDNISKHLIMGHSLGKDVENTVYGHRTLEELTAEMAKIKTKKGSENAPPSCS